jgi:hypothetical protein
MGTILVVRDIADGDGPPIFVTTAIPEGLPLLAAFLALARCPVFAVSAEDEEGEDRTAALSALCEAAREMFAPAEGE